MACLSIALNYYFGQDNVFGYHLINNLIHVISAFFLFLFIYHTLNLPRLRQTYSKNSYGLALLATVFWASNPIQTQAITYIIQRMASMAGMFYIMAMYFYVKARMNDQKKSRILLFILCALTILFSLGSKENTIVLPVTLFIYEILLVQGLSFKEWFSNNWRICLAFVFLISTIVVIYLDVVQGGNLFSFLGRYQSRTFGLKERLLTEPRIILFYITLLLYPMSSRLSLNHDITLSHSLFEPPDTFFAILLIGFLIIGAVFTSKKWPLLAFSILFFFLNHLVESTIIPLELIYEHRNYIPSMLFFLPVSILLIKAASYFVNKKWMQTIILLFIMFLLISQGHSTYIRNSAWKTEENLWLDSVQKYPHLWRPHHNLARVYEKTNRFNSAISEYLLAISDGKSKMNKHEEVMSYNNLGLIYQKFKHTAKALYYYQKAEEINKAYPLIYLNRGKLFSTQGLFDKAISEYLKAIKYDKRSAGAYANLGYALLMKGETDKAIQNLEIGQKLGLNNIRIYRLLGHAYRKKEAYGRSYLMFKKAQELNPQDPITLLSLTELYACRGMSAKRDGALKSLFQCFGDDVSEIKRFLEEIFSHGSIQEALLPERTRLLPLIADECRHRGKEYQDLVDFLSSK